ncbi:YbjN domain-containing protein [Pilimelia columellifera]|uniref:YbjN domain-containing protein n=1 Tax=Pilimelia columellifera TaxID=706574 RepID=UPI003CD0616A
MGELIARFCAERDLPLERTGEHAYAVTLPGTHKLRTVCHLIVGEHALRIEAFVMRQPDERREDVWAWLLRRNSRMYGLAFSIDAAGDIYLTGRVGLGALAEDELDRLLGSALSYADGSFDTLLEIGFGSAIRREWQWRVSRGESVANLRAFAHLFPQESPADERHDEGSPRESDASGKPSV